MELFHAPNTISVATAIALEEAGMSYTPHQVDFTSGAQRSQDYLRINPKGRVPALVIGNDILTETGALLEYIATLSPETGLVPKDPMTAFRMREVMYYLATTMHVAHAHKLRGGRWADRPESHADMTAKVPETMATCCAYLEDNCDFAPYVVGNQRTLADIYLYVIATWLPGDGVTVANYPKLNQFIQAMEERASVKAVRTAGML
ncbi:glutathione S-transferase family protein [Aliiroseovarius sp. KMU-50]|uniref:Glutathione S-transferase family protein n=1 Tax=Aliiroseovarius salicola TaxID=3009082 RepID=A0ABT4VWT2_9RHOB|nr:glutathione S-transferase family protein [Aliiroseovarius sp. KMU-50]MDA5092711.1 glutathione S-transferase family protein [Aliiroseovarius sp. KMU-50]